MMWRAASTSCKGQACWYFREETAIAHTPTSDRGLNYHPAVMKLARLAAACTIIFVENGTRQSGSALRYRWKEKEDQNI